MKKRVLTLLLALCMLFGSAVTVWADDVTHTVTVRTNGYGKVSADGVKWLDSVQVSVPNGDTVGDRVRYKPNVNYVFDTVTLNKIVSVAPGRQFTVLLSDAGEVFTAGSNDMGQLGRGGETSVFAKVSLRDGVKITAVAAGAYHTLLLDDTGTVWEAGYDYYFQKGYFAKIYLPEGVKVAAIAAGESHSVLLDNTGGVWTKGKNLYGQLGRNYNEEYFRQAPLSRGVKIVEIAAGQNHTLLLDDTGRVWAAGRNERGQLGVGSIGESQKKFVEVPLNADVTITDISSGGTFAVLFDSTGAVWTAGANDYGQLCRKTNVSSNGTFEKADIPDGVRIAGIQTGDAQTFLLDTSGSLWTAGYNRNGQLCRSERFQTAKAVNLGKVTEGIGDQKIAAVFSSDTHTYVLDQNGEWWTAGNNDNGQLGRPTGEANDCVLTKATVPGSEDSLSLNWDAFKNLTVTSNVTVVVYFRASEYTVYFNTGSVPIAEKADMLWDDKVLDGVTPPEKNGWKFSGWMCGNRAVTAETRYCDLAADKVTRSITVTAQWKDSEKPTGEIGIGENKWNSMLNNITFGLFFKATQTVTITAVDNSGDDVKKEYLLSAKELTEAELDGKTFTAYTAPFGIHPDNEYIIYVRLTDKAGNTAYICSDGIVIDGTSPVISGIENGKTYCAAQTVTIDEKYVDTVTVNSTAVTLDENDSFVLSPADGEQKIVVTDKAGNTAEMTVTVNNGHTFGEWTSNGDGTHSRFCTACACRETGKCAGGTATCTEKAQCEICGARYGDTEPVHDYGTWTPVELPDGSAVHECVCARCGDTQTAPHSFADWQTQTKKTFFKDGQDSRACTVCGHTEYKVVYSTLHRILRSLAGFGLFLVVSPIVWILNCLKIDTSKIGFTM